MNKQMLQQAYPDATILHEPIPGCPMCSGIGWYQNKERQPVPCICVVVNAPSEKRIAIAAKAWDKMNPEPGPGFAAALQPLKEKLMQIKKHR